MTIKSYVGDGAFHDGIPARDLTDADLAALTEAQRALVNASPLYVDAVQRAEPLERSKSDSAPRNPPAAAPAAEPDPTPETPAADPAA